jgi:plastocyanin
MQTMLTSHSLRTQRVAVEYRMRYVTGRTLTGVRPFWIRANGCKTLHPSYPISGGGDPGSDSRLSWTWKVPMNGRIVAAGGHLHAGAKDMTLRQRECDNRLLLHNDPKYAPSDHLSYNLHPILHEPGPYSTSYFLSRRGISVRKGERLRLTGVYDGEHPRTGVMSIMHVYVAPGRATAARCAQLPSDARQFQFRDRGRSEPPYTRVGFSKLMRNGRIRPIDTLPGPVAKFDGPAVVDVKNGRFVPDRVSVPVGTTLTWRFRDREPHNAYFGNGPGVISAGTMTRGEKRTVNLVRVGRYQLFCYLHPITMHQEVFVTPR